MTFSFAAATPRRRASPQAIVPFVPFVPCGLIALIVAVPAWLALETPARAQSRPSAAASSGSGDPQTPEDRRATLYRDGVDAASAGRWSDARDRFAAALAIRTSPKIYFSLAQSEEQLGLVASAQRDYVRALEGAKAAKTDEVVSAAEKAIANVAPRVPHVRVVVVTDSASVRAGVATATLDDQPIALDTVLAVDPGTHRVVVTTSGAPPATTSVAIGERQQLEVPVSIDAGGGAATGSARAGGTPLPDVPPVAETSGGANAVWRTVGLVTAGAGVATMGLGVYFGFDAKAKNDASNASGCSGSACTSGAAETRREALAAADRSNISFAIGGVLAATGIAIWWLSPRHDVNVAPTAGASGAGIAVQGVWW
jgi:hypothetical protein